MARRAALVLVLLLSILPFVPAMASTAAPGASTPKAFELVGHDPLLSRGMNAAPAMYDHYLYVGSRTDGTHPNAGVLVVDVADPAHPAVVGQIGPPDEDVVAILGSTGEPAA